MAQGAGFSTRSVTSPPPAKLPPRCSLPRLLCAGNHPLAPMRVDYVEAVAPATCASIEAADGRPLRPRYIRRGQLRVTTASGAVFTFGDGTDRPVAIRQAGSTHRYGWPSN